jgi:hypothetical protein
MISIDDTRVPSLIRTVLRSALTLMLMAASATLADAGDRNVFIDHADGSRTVVIERGGNQYGVTYKDGVIVDRFTIYDPDLYRRSGDEAR